MSNDKQSNNGVISDKVRALEVGREIQKEMKRKGKVSFEKTYCLSGESWRGLLTKVKKDLQDKGALKCVK